MVLCNVCRNITFVRVDPSDMAIDHDISKNNNKPPLDFPIHGVRAATWQFSTWPRAGCVAFLHKDWETLEQSIHHGAKRGESCSFCETLYELFREAEMNNRMYRTWITDEMSKGEALWLHSKYIWPGEGNIIHIGRKGNTCAAFRVAKIRYDGNTDEGRSLSRIRVESSNVQVPEEDKSTGSTPALNLARSWLDQCRLEHLKCRDVNQISMTDLPTRLIDVNSYPGGNDIVTLVQPSRRALESTEYATLSHRWGGHMPIQTTTELLEEYERGILLSNLPSTFRDAVSIVRHMGLRYLWIDSICILQNSPQDMDRELPRMADYYVNGTFNIAAAGSEDGRGGCFKERNGRFVGTQTIPVRQSAWCFIPESAYMTLRVNETRKFFSSVSTLSDRGWIFQEELFSRRLMYFQTSHISFSCCTAMAAENFPGFTESEVPFDWPVQEGHYLSRTGALIRNLDTQIKLNGYASRDSVDLTDLYNHWYDAVRKYTKCYLTYEIDRLPGISGLVKKISHISGDTYLAGLWKSDLIRGLCWIADRSVMRVDPYCAPTWSWACLVRPSTTHNYKDERGYQEVVTYYEGKELFRVLDVWTIPAQGNLFGAVKDGSLVVSGHVRIAIARSGSVYGPELLGSGYWDIDVGESYVHLLPIYYDSPCSPTIEDQKPLSLVYCLILQQKHGGTFQRVGCMNCINSYSLDGFRPKLLTIV